MSESTNEQSEIVEDRWEIYVTYVDENPAVIMVDVGVVNAVPVAAMPNLTWVWVTIQDPDEEGFPSEDEDIKLNEIEDLVNDAAANSTTRYVGRITSDGRREFYFYSDDPAHFEQSVSRAMESFADFQYEIDSAEDAEWRHYQDVLFPGAEDLQQIHNQHIIGQLQQAGDPLTVPRPVDHFANFSTEQDRDAFAASVTELGYEIVSRPVRTDQGPLPFAIGLQKVDAVDAESVDDFTFELFDLARKHSGEYEGWASKVVKA